MKKKRTKWIGPLTVVAVLAIWANSRWDTWFHNPEELPYVPASVPHRVLLTFGDEEASSRNVSWQCDTVVRPSHLELMSLSDSSMTVLEATGEVFCSRAGKAAYYVARLRNLRPGEHYAYRVETDGKASQWYDFRTSQPPSLNSHLSFLYVGDVQDTVGGQANRYLRDALQRHPQTEFVVCGGDFVERPTNQDWEVAYEGVDSVAQHLPLLCVTGNHDYLKGVIMKLERRFPLILSYFLDSKIEDNQVYTLRYGDAQFFLLDSNRELPYLLTQKQWLKEQLQQSGARWKIVVLHHPLYSIKGSNNLVQRWVFSSLIEEYGVDLVLQGHEHAYARMTRHGEDGTPQTPVYTVSHCSPKNYRIQFDDSFDKFGISSRYYQTVDIAGDTLRLAAYEVYVHTLYDSLLIVKDPSGQTPRIVDLGRDIPEYMEFTPDPDSKKDQDYAKRIDEYKQRHPERMAQKPNAVHPQKKSKSTNT